MKKTLISLFLLTFLLSSFCGTPALARTQSSNRNSSSVSETAVPPVGSEASRASSAEIAARKDYTTELNLSLQDRIFRAAILPIADFMKTYYDLTGQLPVL